jgi:hypothetical protein
VALNRNDISCDAYGCTVKESFEGGLSPDDVRLRYHVLGWQIVAAEDQEFHYCQSHLTEGVSQFTGQVVLRPGECMKGTAEVRAFRP